MNGKKLFCMVCTAFIVAMLLSFAPPARCEEEAATMKYTVIRLLADSIDPALATIDQGTVIIWLNDASETADIQFIKNEKAASCNGSPFFNDQTKQAMVLGIPFGKTESICLVQKGEFNYAVKRGAKSVEGKILVK